MSNYFELYKIILTEISNHSPENAFQLFENLSFNDYIIQEKVNNPALAQDVLCVLDNMIADGLVNGKITPTKDGKLYALSGLSSLGHQYLSEIDTPRFSDKLKKFVKENGISLTPQGITKLIAQLIF